MTKKLRTYSNEFKAEAVKKIADNNGNISATAKQLGIAMQTLSNWHNKANQGKLVGTEQYDPDLMSALQEIKQLKRQLKVAEASLGRASATSRSKSFDILRTFINTPCGPDRSNLSSSRRNCGATRSGFWPVDK